MWKQEIIQIFGDIKLKSIWHQSSGAVTNTVT